MYAGQSKCTRENVSGERPHHTSPRGGLQMNQPAGAGPQPSLKSRKTRCSGQGNQSVQEDPGRRCTCTGKGSGQGPNRGDCPCPCPRADADTAQSPCGKRKEKDKPCPKTQPVCTEATSPRKGPAQRPIGEGTQFYPRGGDQTQVLLEPDEGCPCKRNYLEIMNRSGHTRTVSDPYSLDVSSEYPYQYTSTPFPKTKTCERQEKRTPVPAHQSDPVPCTGTSSDAYSSYDKHRRPNSDAGWTPPKRTEPSRGTCGPGSNKPRAMNSVCLPSGKQSQEPWKAGQSCQFEGGSYYGNYLAVPGTNVREGANQDERCGQERKHNATRSPPPPPSNTPVGSPCKGSPLNGTFTVPAGSSKSTRTICNCTRAPNPNLDKCYMPYSSTEPTGSSRTPQSSPNIDKYFQPCKKNASAGNTRPAKPQPNVDKYFHPGTQAGSCKEFADDLSSSSEDVNADDVDGQDCVNNMVGATNVCDAYPVDDNPYDDSGAAYSSSSGNVCSRPQYSEQCGPGGWQRPTGQAELDQFSPDCRRRSFPPPACSPQNVKKLYASDPTPCLPQNSWDQMGRQQKPFHSGMSPRPRQVCGADQRCMPDHRRTSPNAQECQQNNFATATPYRSSRNYGAVTPPDFDCSPIRPVDSHQRSQCGKSPDSLQFVTL